MNKLLKMFFTTEVIPAVLLVLFKHKQADIDVKYKAISNLEEPIKNWYQSCLVWQEALNSVEVTNVLQHLVNALIPFYKDVVDGTISTEAFRAMCIRSFTMENDHIRDLVKLGVDIRWVYDTKTLIKIMFNECIYCPEVTENNIASYSLFRKDRLDDQNLQRSSTRYYRFMEYLYVLAIRPLLARDEDGD